MKKLAIILMAMFLVLPLTASANLLINPGFETGDTTGWTPSALAYTDNRLPFVHDGSYGVILDSFVTPPGDDTNLTQSILLPGAGTYQFGGWLRAFTVGSEVGVWDQIQFSSWISSEGATLGSSVGNFSNFQDVTGTQWQLTRASEWTFFTGTFNYTGPANGSALFNFNLQNRNSNVVSVAAGDSFFVEAAPVPEPSTMLLLGSGLVGLVGYGRRRFKK